MPGHDLGEGSEFYYGSRMTVVWLGVGKGTGPQLEKDLIYECKRRYGEYRVVDESGGRGRVFNKAPGGERLSKTRPVFIYIINNNKRRSCGRY